MYMTAANRSKFRFGNAHVYIICKAYWHRLCYILASVKSLIPLIMFYKINTKALCIKGKKHFIQYHRIYSILYVKEAETVKST